MRLIAKLALAGAGMVALAGGAIAAEQEMHVMKVQLADGSVAHIRYAGDKKPQIAVVPPEQQQAPVAVVIDPVAARFAAMNAMFADMDRQMDAMMRQAAAMRRDGPTSGGGGAPALISTGAMPAGGVSHSIMTSSNGKCTRTVETFAEAGKAPRTIEKTSGDCGSVSAAPAPAPKAAPKPPAKPAPAAAPRTVGRDDV